MLLLEAYTQLNTTKFVDKNKSEHTVKKKTESIGADSSVRQRV